MRPMGRLCRVAAVLIAVSTFGCANRDEGVLLSTKSPVELRAIQTRAFETQDRAKMMRTIIATLQDLGYNLDKVDATSGTISATKLAQLRITASVYPRGDVQIMVRANAIVKAPNVKETQVDDPNFYQQLFFEPLSKAIFLNALQVDDADASHTDSPVADKPAANNTSNAQ